MKNVLIVFNNLDAFAAVFPLLAAIYKKMHFKGSCLYISLYFMVQLVLNGIADYMSDKEINNIIVYQLNCFCSLLILTLFFKKVIVQEKMSRSLKYSWVLVAILGIYLFFEKRDAFNSHSFSYTGIVIIVYCLFYFYYKIKNPTFHKITREPVFWFVTGLFSYYAATFVIWGSYRMLTEQHIDTNILWRLWIFFFLILCGYTTVGFLCSTSQKTY